MDFFKIKKLSLIGLILLFNTGIFGQNTDSLKIQRLYKQIDQSFQNQQFEKCRDYAEEILQIDDSNCYAYMLLGVVYASIPKTYLEKITKEHIERQAIYCLAVDMFLKASEVDTLCILEANKKIDIYSKYFPSVEEIWIDNYDDIEYTFGGWINRTTKVRFREFLKNK